MTSSEQIVETHVLPNPEEFFDAVRRHICQVLGFDFGLIDIVQGHEVVNIMMFSAADAADLEAGIYKSLENEHQQPLVVAHTLIAQKVKQTQKPWVGKVFKKGDASKSYPYAIVPIIENTSESGAVVKGLIRVVTLDETRQIDEKDLSTLILIGQHLAGRLSQFKNESSDDSEQTAHEESKILIVYSNRVVRRRLSRILSERYQVVEIDNGHKALEILQSQDIDLVVLDSEVQGVSGIGFCKVLKQSPLWKHTPVILVTDDSNVNGKIEGLNAGADDCLSDNCHDAELLARVKASLRLRKTERELATQWQLLEDYAQRLEQAFESERQASVEVSKHNQSLEELNRELQQSKLKEKVLRGQDQLLFRISDIIRKSFNIKENVERTLEELVGHFNLDCCFAVIPSEEDLQDSIRTEYCVEEEYKVMDSDLDLSIYEAFKSNFTPEQMLIVSDVMRERSAEIFHKGILKDYPIYSLFYVPITFEDKLLGILGGHRCESAIQWTTENHNFLKSIAGQIAIGVTNARLYARVQRQATTDGLTGLFNHRTGQEKLAEQLRLAERYQRTLSVIMIDVDHFKRINDTYGHPAGDAVLKSVAKLIRSDCRDVDIPVRYGGEEFLLVLPEINREGASIVAERIRRKLSQAVINHDGVNISITSSFGVAAFPDDAENQQQLLDVVDKALYMSKRLGRNQVHSVPELGFANYLESENPATTTVQPAVTLIDSNNDESPVIHQINMVPQEKEVAGSNATKVQTIMLSKSQSPHTEELVPEVIEMVKAMASALYSKSEYNKEHHLESARFAELMAKVLGLSPKEVEQIRVASLLHDVGVLSIPDEVMNKPGIVSNEEMEMIAQHPVLGAELLRPIHALKEICEIVENHHECWDGSGYPRGLKGEKIPLASRIVAIVDAYHAMISNRPYRQAMSKDQAKRTLRNGAGTQWDPFLVEVFLKMLENMDKT